MPLFMAIGAGVGALKNGLVDQPQYQRQKTLAAATQRYSPWTGLKADMPKEPNMAGDILSYGAQGGMLGQGMGNAKAANNLAAAQSAWLKQNSMPGAMEPMTAYDPNQFQYNSPTWGLMK